MSRRSVSLFNRRLGFFLAALGVLAGFWGPWPMADSWASVPGGAGSDPSQVRLLPVGSGGPARGPILLGRGVPSAPDPLSAASPHDSPVSLTPSSAPVPAATPTGSARQASVAWKASVLHRIHLEAHAPPSAR
jgi:hypothetical protein